MKKHLFFLLAAMFAFNAANASPVDEKTAQKVGRNFANANFNFKQNSELKLVYTGISTRGETCFYAYNVNNKGFVIVSADDRFRPIVGYSNEGVFETENMSPEAKFYLDKIIEARTSPNAVLFDDTEAEWQSVMKDGKLISRNGGREASYLVQTTWNQDSPYNLYAPDASGGPGGRCYAGCVATAMSQVMKYWDFPAKGTGSHSYHCSYGQLSANFGQTDYNWEHMPNQLIGSSTDEEIDAVALLMYHCGVSVDMGFGPNGSGAYSGDVPYAIKHYFSYSNQANDEYRDYYSLSQWQNKLKESFDLQWPVYYSGYSNDGGHAFVCDGYDDNDLFHFNWGWDGSNDGWFVIDEIDFAGWASAIFNFVPSDVYQYMPKQPENLQVTSLGDMQCSATLTWKNPTKNIHNNDLTTIDQIVITRNGQIIYTENNVALGVNMEYTDHYMPTMVNYAVYAVVNSAKGLPAEAENIILGPTSNWTVEMTAPNAQGWNGGYLSFVNSSGIEIAQATANSASATQTVEMPIGHVSLCWNLPSEDVENLGFVLKNGQGNVVTSFEGSSTELSKGMFYLINNTLSPEIGDAPINLSVSRQGNDAILNWLDNNDQTISYFIYRDGLLYGIAEENHFTDSQAANAFHAYKVTAFNAAGESSPSAECHWALQGECDTPLGLRYEKLAGGKVKVIWDAPQGADPTGYMVYRRTPGTEFKRIKLTSSTNYSDNLKTQPCDRYQYAVTAYYSETQCESAYAPTQNEPSLNFMEVNKTIIPFRLSHTIEGQKVRLNWQEALLAETYTVYRDGEIIAEGLTETEYIDETIAYQQNCDYYVIGISGNLVSSPSNTIHVDWTLGTTAENSESLISVYPNPAADNVFVKAEGQSHVEIYNLMGQCVMEKDLRNGGENISIANLPKGSYFIRINGDKENATIKFIKM